MFEQIKSVCRMVWGFLRVAWWAVFLVAGIFRRKEQGSSISLDDALEERAPSFSTTAREKIDQALVDVRVEQVIAKAKTAEDRAKLQEIREEPDGKERRKRLAVFLQERL